MTRLPRRLARAILAAGALAPLLAAPAVAQEAPGATSPTARTARPARAPRASLPAQAPLPIHAPALTLAEAEALLVDRNLAVIAARRGVDVARAQRLVANTRPAGSIGYSQTTGQVNEGGSFRSYNGER